MDIIAGLLAIPFILICAAFIFEKLEDMVEDVLRRHDKKRAQKLKKQNFNWRRKHKSPFVWDTGGKDPFEHLDTTYMDRWDKDLYRQRQRNRVLELCGAKFRYSIDAWFYDSAQRIPVVDSYGKTICYHVPHNQFMSCYPEEMPELPHIVITKFTKLNEIQEKYKPLQEGDIIFLERYRDGWFARIVKILPARHFQDRMILKLEPVYSTPENPNGWICGDEIEYAYTHNTPPIPSREAKECA